MLRWLTRSPKSLSGATESNSRRKRRPPLLRSAMHAGVSRQVRSPHLPDRLPGRNGVRHPARSSLPPRAKKTRDKLPSVAARSLRSASSPNSDGVRARSMRDNQLCRQPHAMPRQPCFAEASCARAHLLQPRKLNSSLESLTPCPGNTPPTSNIRHKPNATECSGLWSKCNAYAQLER